MASLLFTLFCLLILWEGSSHILNSMVEKPMQQGTQEAPSQELGGSETLSKTSHQWAWEYSCPRRAFRWDHRPSRFLHPLWETLRQRHTVEFHLDSWPMETEKVDVCCCKLLTFGVICYAVTDDSPSYHAICCVKCFLLSWMRIVA